MHLLKCIIFYRQVCNYRKWLKNIGLGPAQLFSHPLLCDLPSPPKCEFIVPSSRIFHLHHWVLPIKVGDNWKLYPHPTLLQVVSSPKALLIPVFYDKRSPILTRTLIFSNIKKFPSQKKKHNKITFKHLLFLKGGEDLSSDLLMTFYCTRQQHCIWKHKTSLRTFLASGLKWLFWH